MSKLYAQDGVNVAEGDSFSVFAAKMCRKTYNNSPFVEIVDHSRDHFRGPRGWMFKNLPKGYFIVGAPDGIGTKVVIIDAAGMHRSAAFDLLAMTCGDISREGGLPILFTSVLDVSTLGKEGDKVNNAARLLISGLVEAANKIGIVLYKGETAELGICIGSENPRAKVKFNWSGFAIGVNHPNKIIVGKSLVPGQAIVGLRDRFRSNGISSVRGAFRKKFGDNWWNDEGAAETIKEAAMPSILYDRFLATANGWFDVNFEAIFKMYLIVHVTGGAIKSKFAEDILFPMGLSARLDNLWEPPKIMKDCAEWRGMSDQECYAVWNGGQGMLVVVDQADNERFIAMAKEFGIEAKVCGEITRESQPSVIIFSKFTEDKVIEYKK